MAHQAPALRQLGFDVVHVVGHHPAGTLPVRMGFRWQQPATQQPRGKDGAAAPTAAQPPSQPPAFLRDRFLTQLDPVTAEHLELAKLQPYRQLQYQPSRNRQYHLYTATERPDARSYPVRRLFVRGLVRQLASPAVLASSYAGKPCPHPPFCTALIERPAMRCRSCFLI